MCVLFAEHTAPVTDGQSTCAREGNPSECEVCFSAQSDVMAARVVGIRHEGESLPDGAVHEGRGTRTAAMTSRERCKVREPSIAALVRELRVAALVLHKKKNGEQKQASLSGEQDSQVRGERPPCLGHRINH